MVTVRVAHVKTASIAVINNIIQSNMQSEVVVTIRLCQSDIDNFSTTFHDIQQRDRNLGIT